MAPIGQVVSYGMVAGPDNSLLTQPSRAIIKAAAKAGIDLGSIDLFEINEAFAAVGLASVDDLGIDEEKVNVNGGAIALGHPVGMSGTRVALSALLELRRRGASTAAVALCGGGGQGDAAISAPSEVRASGGADSEGKRELLLAAEGRGEERDQLGAVRLHLGPGLDFERIDTQRARGEARAHRQQVSLLVP